MRKNAIFSYFDTKTAGKSFLVGTYNNYDENNILSRYDDLDSCTHFLQKGCQMSSIQCYLGLVFVINDFFLLVLFHDHKIIGYQTVYTDIFNKNLIIKRLANDYNSHKFVFILLNDLKFCL